MAPALSPHSLPKLAPPPHPRAPPQSRASGTDSHVVYIVTPAPILNPERMLHSSSRFLQELGAGHLQSQALEREPSKHVLSLSFFSFWYKMTAHVWLGHISSLKQGVKSQNEERLLENLSKSHFKFFKCHRNIFSSLHPLSLAMKKSCENWTH